MERKMREAKASLRAEKAQVVRKVFLQREEETHAESRLDPSSAEISTLPEFSSAINVSLHPLHDPPANLPIWAVPAVLAFQGTSFHHL